MSQDPDKTGPECQPEVRPGFFRRLFSPLREFGVPAGVLYLIDRLLERLSPRLRLYCYELVAQPVRDKPLLSAGLTKNLEFRQLHAGDQDVRLMPARPEIVESRFRQNAICLGVYQKGVLIGYGWFCFGTYDEDEVRCTYALPSDGVFDFDVYVFPEKRLGVAFMAIWHGANELLRQRGVRTSFSRVSRFNLMSRRSHARLGATIIGRAVFLQLWRFEAMLATVSPFVSISFRRHRPRFVLRKN